MRLLPAAALTPAEAAQYDARVRKKHPDLFTSKHPTVFANTH